MPNRVAHYRLFWREFRRTFHSTGALLPSGRSLCRALARYATSDGHGQPRRLLEVGPGTGVVTDEIIRRMGPDDRLDLVELNDRFVAALGERLASDGRWKQAADRVQIHHLPVELLCPTAPYDAMVSGLPLNNFAADAVHNIFGRLESLAARGATLSFFEYVAVRKAKALAGSPAERRRLAGVEAAMGEACDGRRFRRECVVANLPPAWVHHLRFA